MKTLILLALAFVAAALTGLGKMKGRKQLQLLEGGRLCVYCRSTELTSVDKLNTPEHEHFLWR